MREELSVCEAPIMKIIWESNPDISVPELVKQLNEQYGKEYGGMRPERRSPSIMRPARRSAPPRRRRRVRHSR